MDDIYEEQRINEFTSKGNYHAALNLALSAMNEHRRNHQQYGVDKYISMMKDIVNIIDKEFGRQDK